MKMSLECYSLCFPYAHLKKNNSCDRICIKKIPNPDLKMKTCAQSATQQSSRAYPWTRAVWYVWEAAPELVWGKPGTWLGFNWNFIVHRTQPFYKASEKTLLFLFIHGFDPVRCRHLASSQLLWWQLGNSTPCGAGLADKGRSTSRSLAGKRHLTEWPR